MSNYQSEYTGPQIDEAVGKALNRTLPAGGTQGQVLAKSSNTDFAAEWVNQTQETQSSNRNLLDNPWFTVNQRGVSGEHIGYGYDRWISNNNAAAVDGHLVLKPQTYAFQRLEPSLLAAITGEIVTFSALKTDGTIVSGQWVVDPSTADVIIGEDEDVALHYSQWSSGWGFDAKNNCAIKAAKLELGDVSTLRLDTAPNYATELLKCQRYYNKYSTPKLSHTGIRGNDGYVRLTHYFPVEMRTDPAITNISSANGIQYTVDAKPYAVFFGATQQTNAWGDYINFDAVADL